MNSQPALTVIIMVAVIVATATLMVMKGRKQAVWPGRPLSPQAAVTSFVSGVVLVAVAFILIVLLSAAYTTYEVQSSQSKWCDTLTLLTSHPVPKPADPAANPSREQAYVLYTDFVTLQDRFGCT